MQEPDITRMDKFQKRKKKFRMKIRGKGKKKKPRNMQIVDDRPRE